MTWQEAITRLNVLSSYDTEKEKRDQYKECINALIQVCQEYEELKKNDSRTGS